MKTLIYLMIALSFLYGCSDEAQTPQNGHNENQTPEQLNISILLDLSDRIIENRKNDEELVKYITEYFKSHIEKKNVFFIKDHMKVLFYPEPQNEKINALAESLKVKLDPSDKAGIKSTWENITTDYSEKLAILYNYAMEEGEENGFPGSDIWRFFSNKVSDYCIEQDSNYRNVLVILTDGYLYHKDSFIIKGNKTSFLTASHMKQQGLRNNLNWEKKFDEGNYGFISKRDDLQNLEVLILEINPSTNYRNDDEIIKKYWSDWMEAQNVKRYKIYTSGLPSNTKELINSFLDTK